MSFNWVWGNWPVRYCPAYTYVQLIRVQATDMDLTFDGQGVGVRGGLVSDIVVRLARVCSAVFVTSHVNLVRGRFDSGHCAVKLPGEVGGGYRGSRTNKLHYVIHLYSLWTLHLHSFRTV